MKRFSLQLHLYRQSQPQSRHGSVSTRRAQSQTTAELEMGRVVWSLRICLGSGGRQMQGRDRGGYLGARVVTTVVVAALRDRTSSIFMTVCCLFCTSVKVKVAHSRQHQPCCNKYLVSYYSNLGVLGEY